MNFTIEYESLKYMGENWFSGINTYKGFENGLYEYTDERKLKRLLIVKGAPGSGKSTFMRYIADNMEKTGNKITRLLCSSDPDSIDGIVINDTISVVDGTAPHSIEMTYAGASSEIIDLCKFLNKDNCAKKRDEIIRLSDKKNSDYINAYKSLSHAQKMNRLICDITKQYFNLDKALKAVDKIICAAPKSDFKKPLRKYIHSIGIKGICRLNTFSGLAENKIYINDYYGTSSLFMNLLYKRLISAEIEFLYSLDSFGIIDDIFTVNNRLLISRYISDNANQVINMSKYTKELKDNRGELKLIKKLRDSYLEDAVNYLYEAGKSHFEIEKIYGDDMDYSAVMKEANEYLKIISRILT